MPLALRINFCVKDSSSFISVSSFLGSIFLTKSFTVFSPFAKSIYMDSSLALSNSENFQLPF